MQNSLFCINEASARFPVYPFCIVASLTRYRDKDAMTVETYAGIQVEASRIHENSAGFSVEVSLIKEGTAEIREHFMASKTA